MRIAAWVRRHEQDVREFSAARAMLIAVSRSMIEQRENKWVTLFDVIGRDLERAMDHAPDAEEIGILDFAAQTATRLAKYLSHPKLEAAHPEWRWQMATTLDCLLYGLGLDGVDCIARHWVERGLAVAGRG
jgi:hypothetical protein